VYKREHTCLHCHPPHLATMDIEVGTGISSELPPLAPQHQPAYIATTDDIPVVLSLLHSKCSMLGMCSGSILVLLPFLAAPDQLGRTDVVMFSIQLKPGAACGPRGLIGCPLMKTVLAC